MKKKLDEEEKSEVKKSIIGFVAAFNFIFVLHACIQEARLFQDWLTILLCFTCVIIYGYLFNYYIEHSKKK